MNWEIGQCVTYTDTETGQWAKGVVTANVDSDGHWNRVQRFYNYRIPSSQVRSVEFDSFVLEV